MERGEVEDSPSVAPDLALDLPRRDVPRVELEAGDAACGLDVAPLVVAHVVDQHGDNVVLPHDHGPLGEGEQGVNIVGRRVEDGADELIVDPH